jgi:hypothetical protein
MAAKGRHIKFGDDGTATAVKHDEEAFVASISRPAIRKKEESKAVQTNPHVLNGSENMAIRSAVQEKTNIVYGASLLETVPEEIFFGILDVLV